MPSVTMEAPPKAMINVSQDSSQLANNLSDLTTTPPKRRGDNDDEARRKSMDAKMKRKWARNIEKEKAHERKRAQQAKQQQKQQEATNDSNCSSQSFVEISKDLMPIPICDEASTDSPPLKKMNESSEDDIREVSPLDMSNSLIDPQEPALVSPDEKESHKVLDALDTSGSKQVYSPQEQEYFKFHEQLYAPQEQDYLSFLKDLELEQENPSTQQKEFADWLQGMGDKDIQPIPTDACSDEAPKEKKRVAFSKETTVRFFSRTREELLQLRRRYKNIGRRNRGVPDDEGSSDEEDWPLFKYLDDKLKEIEESNAWEDPMAAVTDMFSSKNLKAKMSPILCVSCEDPTSNVNDGSVDRSLADLDDDDGREAAKALASTKAAAAIVDGTLEVGTKEHDVSFSSADSAASGISALWFAVPYKSPHAAADPEGAEFFVSPGSSKSDTTKSSTSDPDEQTALSSPPRLERTTPKSLRLIKATGSAEERTTAVSSYSADPDAPKKQSLSWLADDLDSPGSHEGGISMLSGDDPNISGASDVKNTSLGRNTNSSLLRRVSEHLNTADESGRYNSSIPSSGEDTHVPLANSLFDTPESNSNPTSERRSVAVSVSEVEKLVGKENSRKSPVSKNGGTSPKELSSSEKKRVVNGAKRWAASQKLKATTDRRSNAVISPSVGSQQRVIDVVTGAKRWSASQKAASKKPRPATPSLNDGPDLDESRDWDVNRNGILNVNDSNDRSRSHDTQEGPDLDESKHDDGYPADGNEIDFDYAAGGEISNVDSNPWLSSEDGPDIDEAKDWHASFSEPPDLTVTTGSISQDHPSWEDGEEWVAFPTSDSRDVAYSLNDLWTATFPSDERPQASSTAPTKSSRKPVRSSPSKSSRVKELASRFERQRAASPLQRTDDGAISPRTPTTPWADSHGKQEDPVEYPDLQQPVLDESRSGSDSSPISVTHM